MHNQSTVQVCSTNIREKVKVNRVIALWCVENVH